MVSASCTLDRFLTRGRLFQVHWHRKRVTVLSPWLESPFGGGGFEIAANWPSWSSWQNALQGSRGTKSRRHAGVRYIVHGSVTKVFKRNVQLCFVNSCVSWRVLVTEFLRVSMLQMKNKTYWRNRSVRFEWNFVCKTPKLLDRKEKNFLQPVLLSFCNLDPFGTMHFLHFLLRWN